LHQVFITFNWPGAHSWRSP